MIVSMPAVTVVAAIGSLAWLGPESKASARAELPAVRAIDRWIDLSGSERPALILCPDRPEYRKAAQIIAKAIERLGAPRPVISFDTAKMTPATHNVVALGNVNNNTLIARLYFNYYAYEDSLLPGPGAWSLRTVYDPYPWHGQGDVLLVGVSEDKDAVKAAAALAKHIRSGKTKAGVGYLLEVSSATSLTETERRALASRTAPSFFDYLYSASRYLKTGQADYARHAIETLQRIVDRYDKDSQSDCDWPEETHSGQILATWDAFEECPLISDEQRLLFTRAFLKFMRSLRRHVSGYGRIGRDDLVTWNHTTFPLLGLYFGARYFRDYYQLPEATEYLTKARACFLAQARSWKPQEDADTYLTLTMTHTMRYCLAEWQLEFFESGLGRQLGDYVISVCDSRGWLSGFGDSGIGRAPILIKRMLPLLFWWYRDPGYLWVLEHVTDGQWRNPFHRDIKPRKPDRLVGLKVFKLDRQLYEYTKRYRVYTEPLSPPNVPLEAAFDKIAFRASWNKDAQYMLLDGFGRGKHLHYDTNAIIVLADRGQRWLIDHDYLTRNTTEHNMVSVLRDGRATTLVPSCAGLLCAADVGGRIALTGTQVRDYRGIDWQRYIFWHKGSRIVVLDRMTARQSGHYDIDIVWKSEDRGDERIAGNRSFIVRRLQVPCRTRAAAVIEDAQASAGKAVLLDRGESSLAVAVDLPRGKYKLAVRAYGQDTGSDSLFVHTANSQTVALGTPRLRYGPIEPQHARRAAVPINLTRQGRQILTFTLRERPPVRIDKIMFFDANGRLVMSVEAEDAPTPTDAEIASLPADRFWIKWSAPALVSIKRTHPKGIVVPVCKLLQRLSRRLSAGQTVELANLLYVDRPSESLDVSLNQIGPGAALLLGSETALYAVRGAAVEKISFDADMLVMSPNCLAWANGRSARIGTATIKTTKPCNLELDLDTMRAKALTPEGKSLKVQMRGLPQAVRETLSYLAKSAKQRARSDNTPQAPKQPATSGTLPAPTTATSAWRFQLSDNGPVRRLKTADIDADGQLELLVAAGRYAYALQPDGKVVWSYRLAGECYDIEAGELLPEKPGLEVVLASGDTYVHLLDATGRLINKHQIRGAVWNQNYGDHPWQAYTVAVRDLDQNGRNEILVGTQNYELHIYDAQWNMLARTRRAVLHGSIDFITADVDADGKLELFATDHYGRVQAFEHDGSKAAAFYTSIGDMQATLADLDQDGQLDLIYGSSTGDMVATKLPPGKVSRRGAKTLWRFDNFGYAVNRIRAADLTQNGRPEVIVASGTGYLYVLDADGQLIWQDPAGTDIVEALVLEHPTDTSRPNPAPRLAYFDRGGTLTLATSDGRRRKQFQLGQQPRLAIQRGEILVVGFTRSVSAYSIRQLWPSNN